MANYLFAATCITEVSEEYPPLAPRVGIVANMQANLVLQLLIEHENGN